MIIDVPSNTRSKRSCVLIFFFLLVALTVILNLCSFFFFPSKNLRNQPVRTFTEQLAAKSILIGISSISTDFRKRELIRSHQISLYKGYDITWKFILSKPPDSYMEMIEKENEENGDLIILLDVEDTRETANGFKNFEFFKRVENDFPFYNYVAKMDDDTFMNIPLFWTKYFTADIRKSSNTVIGRIWSWQDKWPEKVDFPEGGFYAISWDLMIQVNKFYDRNNRSHKAEDMQLGYYFMAENIPKTLVDLTSDVAFHFNPWVEDRKAASHTVFKDSVRIHALKVEQDYIMVSSCFTSEGIDEKRLKYLKSQNWFKKLPKKITFFTSIHGH